MKTILIDAVGTLIIKGEGVHEEMQLLLDSYPNHKVIVSNANNDELIDYGLDRGLPYELFTLKHNPNKVDPKFFEILLERYDLKPNDVVYFEHSREACKSAESLGIPTYFYDHAKQDLVGLKNFLNKQL